MMPNTVRGIGRNMAERKTGARRLDFANYGRFRAVVSANPWPWRMPKLFPATGLALQRLKWERNKRRNFRKAIRRAHAD